MQLVLRIPKQTLIRAGEKNSLIIGMIQLGARQAVPRGYEHWSGAREAFARQRRRPARCVQSPTRHVTIYKECVPHERLWTHCSCVRMKTISGWWHRVATAASGASCSACRLTDGLVVR